MLQYILFGLALGSIYAIASSALVVTFVSAGVLNFAFGSMAYVAVFGTLFLLTRWWRQANPLRPARLSLWWVFVSMAVAALVAWLWAFPESWAAIVAGATSVSVQLASPWVHPRERSRRKKV